METAPTTNSTTIPIIYWTKWFGIDQWEGFTIENCPQIPSTYKCQITHDRRRAIDSSVIIFHASDVQQGNNDELPPSTATQAWVYHTAEAPNNKQNGVINLMQYSMTYRLDSDFPWGYFEDPQKLIGIMEKPPLVSKDKKRTSAPIAWIVSNCNAQNYRHHYVQELKKWIDIDIYGHCLNNQIYPDNTTTVELISQYHFYLALENSNCKDYVTEKLLNTYIAGVIPIVDGPSDYGPFIPNDHAIIRLDDFANPRQLATYLKLVLNNDELYDRYLSYKKPGGIANSSRFWSTLETYKQGTCRLCKVAYERYVKNPDFYYPGKKIYPDNTCINNKHFNYRSQLIETCTSPFTILSCFIVCIMFYFLFGRRMLERKAWKKLNYSN
ncbi:hypothetical protein BDF20DRAFT_839194 [Mycotypha africana]|uniref:uncharacterized protein n=1 Tax=Mycotypha africana TaxID=64632 RepID=UPI0022FFCD2F|nr:uncharacterized protein BDF20DRAFT_839194 [Mycotypha africana]KAI8969257.1 hypothetical protein BDF20DRAFT_839194 [Mycotypha africana]